MEIDGKTKVYGLVGHPVAHSLSPLIQNTAFRELGIKAVYVVFDVTDLSGALEGIKGLNIEGVNITIPWKHEVLPLLDKITETARLSGAANTIVREGKRLIGTNTDVSGLIRLFRRKGLQWKGHPVTILGAGGAARAAVIALKSIGADPVVFNRKSDFHLAIQLSEDLGCQIRPLESITITPDTVAVINCTPVGMSPNESALPIPASLLRSDLVVMDAVYSPVQTKLLRIAKRLGCTTIPGIEWLIAQGADAFKFWTGQDAPEETMRKILLDRTNVYG